MRNKSVTKSSSKGKFKEKIGIILFLGIFATVGTLVFYFFTVKTLIKQNDAETWAKVPCEIVSSRVKSHSGKDNTTYSVDIHYQYKYNGQSWTCSDYSFDSGSSSGYDGKNAVVRQYPKGKKTQCFVNPQKPYEAVISREGGTRIIIGAIFGLVFGLVGYGGIFVTLFGKGKRRTRQSGLRKGKKSQAYQRKERNEINDYNSQWAVDVQQNVELKPRSSRLGKLLIILFMCVFWNSITWVFVLDGIKSGSTFTLLFMSIFVIIGLCLVGAVIHQLLALSNAKLKIIVSSDVVKLGESFAFTWAIPQKVERISNLKISFVGTESATYRRGTNTHTDRNEFYTEIVAETSDHNEMSSGSAIIDLPPTLMHSFDSGNNKIVWQLKVHGDIKSWPDIKDDYEIEIMPMGR